MAKKRAEGQQENKASKQSKQAKALDELAQQEEPAAAQADIVGSAGNPNIENVAARLSNERLPAAQRQEMAKQVGNVQGNLYLQRVMDVIQHERTQAADAIEPPQALESGWQMPLSPGSRLVSSDATLQRAISTPLPKGAKKQKGGKAALTVKGLRITLLPDRPAEKGEGVGQGEGRTVFKFVRPEPTYTDQEMDNGDWVIRNFTLEKPTMVIQTLWGEGATAETEAEYGRGTAPEDIAAGKTNLGYHEGSHGTDYLEYMKTKDVPQFMGKKGMLTPDFEVETDKYVQGWMKFEADMDMFSKLRTDCVGDKHEQCVVWEKSETPEEGEGEGGTEGETEAAPEGEGEASE
ncbi:MAG: hypothetical protein PVH65_12275 [Chloroflexota bacterium]|jgi:hypothetical protein